MGMFEAQLGPESDRGFKALVAAAKSDSAYVMLSAAYRTSPEGARVAAPTLLEAYGPIACSGAAMVAHQPPDRTTTYPKMLQSLAEWVPDAGHPSRARHADTAVPLRVIAPVGRISRQAAEPSKLFSIGTGPSIRLLNRESPRVSRDILIVIVTSCARSRPTLHLF